VHLYSEASLLYKITFFFFIPVSSSQLLLLVGLGYLFYWSYRSPVKEYWDYWHLLDSYSGNVHARPTTQIHCGYCLLRRRTKKYQCNVFHWETTYKFTVSWCGAPYELAQFDHAPSTKNVYDLLALIQSNYPFSHQGNIRIPMLLFMSGKWSWRWHDSKQSFSRGESGEQTKPNFMAQNSVLPYLDMCLIT